MARTAAGRREEKEQVAKEVDQTQSLEEAEKMIDLSKAMLPQVWKLGRHYEAWVHRPSLQPYYRLFESDFVEMFSKTVWYVVPLIWIPVAMCFLYMSVACGGASAHLHPSHQLHPNRSFSSPDPSSSFSSSSSSSSFHNSSVQLSKEVCSYVQLSAHVLSVPQMVCLAVMGILLWSLLEYCLHRFLFHLVMDTPGMILFHFFLHGQHHKFPCDPLRLVFPPVAATGIAVPIYFLMFLPLFPLHAARCIMAGALLGYVSYDLTHYFLHHGSPSSRYFASLKADHMVHHFRIPTKGFGISSKLWDVPFGTLIPQRERSP